EATASSQKDNCIPGKNMTDSTNQKGVVRFLSEYSVPLIAGVVVAMVTANYLPSWYDHIVHSAVYDLFHAPAEHAHGHGHDHHASPWEHYLSLHFLVNDIFMVLFFGVAAKEITEACLPGGALNPPSKAINPLCGTIGGVLGPVAVFFGLNAIVGQSDWTNGWGIPTATDIALAWLVAKLIFGKGHPAISFLLLLAVADDAIGLGIIAFAYPDPAHPTEWANALWILPGMGTALMLRKCKLASWIPYVAICGTLCWWGLFSAHLHPALALVFVVPFIPGPNYDLGLYAEYVGDDASEHNTPLEQFEHATRHVVDFGLFFFAFANAGVSLQGVSGLTFIVLASLLVGKTLGITGFSYLAAKAGFRLPLGMNLSHLVVASVIAGLGLTVALFVSGQAFTDSGVQGAAKMGALLSVLAGPIALVVAVALGVANVKVKLPLFAVAKKSKANVGA
ncbi:MAG: Na+/H+ antiporter NhaA, partial [Planctomycetales bacterium]|nr:Na+/H+ antiporter NhaA [Planctomycetales bacterium]